MLDVFLNGRRVVLRPFQEAMDAPALLRWWNHPACREHLETGGLPVSSLSEIPQLESRRSLRLSIVLTDGNLAVGTACLNELQLRHRRAELFVLIQPEWQRRRLGLEAAELLLRHAFGSLGLELLTAQMDERHQAGRRLAARLGFEQVALLPKWNLHDGRRTDEIILGLTRARLEQLDAVQPNPWSN